MALEIDQVARLVAVARVEKVVESDFQKSRQRRVGGDVAADARVVLVLADHHGHGVPADQALDAALHGAVARVRNLILGTDRVHIGGVELDRQFRAADARALGQLVQQVGGTVRTGFVDDLIQGFHPFRCLLRIEVDNPLVQFLVHG